MTIGETIKHYRTEQGLTQKKLGELSGMNDVAIRKYESGKVTPKLQNLQKIAAALGIKPEILYQDKIIIKVPRKITEEQKKCLEDERVELAFLNQMDAYRELLNERGQAKALEQVEMITKIPEYKKE